jgi:Ca2+-binding RTX toxin-like protein
MTGGRLDIGHLMQLLGVGGGGGGSPPPSGTATNGSDPIVGTTGDDIITGVPASSTTLGRGTVDTLTGNGGNDVFVLGDSRGNFYDDGKIRTNGTSDYALIKDFNAGDKIQVAGSAVDYYQHATTINGISGSGIYYDANHNHLWDNKDELIGLVQGVASVATSDFIFGGP